MARATVRAAPKIVFKQHISKRLGKAARHMLYSRIFRRSLNARVRRFREIAEVAVDAKKAGIDFRKTVQTSFLLNIGRLGPLCPELAILDAFWENGVEGARIWQRQVESAYNTKSMEGRLKTSRGIGSDEMQASIRFNKGMIALAKLFYADLVKISK